MITTAEMGSLWATITPQKGNSIGRRVDPAHPLDFFATYDEQNNMQFMLLSSQLPDIPSSSQQILVRGNKRSDGDYAICLSLVNVALRDLFISLCWDIMDCTSHSMSRQSGVDAAIKRFRMWQTLLAEQQSKRMSDEETKGLIGELLVMKLICIPRYGIEVGVSSWVGPLKADRDFELASVWFEAKAISLSSDRINISSFEQLDTDVPGFLVICRIEKTSIVNAQSFSLKSLIHELDAILSGNANSATIFHNRLAFSGYNLEDDRVEQPYILHSIEQYCVTDQFPRICRNELPVAVCDGKYSLSIAAVQPWRIELEGKNAEL